jgi:hypothetical protein
MSGHYKILVGKDNYFSSLKQSVEKKKDICKAYICKKIKSSLTVVIINNFLELKSK